MASNFEKYFEWHGKIHLKEEKLLDQICEDHKVHLSLNSLKGESDIRFITLREYGDIDVFQDRKNSLINCLEGNNWQVLKEQSEYCIYDDNNYLDAGWLPQ